MTDPYAGVDMPKPPKGYRLARWGEEAVRSFWWEQNTKQWLPFGELTTYWYHGRSSPTDNIFAIPKPRIRIPLEPANG